MQISCVQCKTSLPITATFCDACGRPVDADRDGVPDALGNMIEQKARAIVAEQRKADEAVVEAKKRQDLVAKLTTDESETEVAIQANEKLPRSFFGAFTHLALVITFSVFFAWFLIGPLVHFLFSVFDVSPAGIVLCPMQCDTCEGPGRTFAWSYKGSWQDNKGRMGYALVCHNGKIKIDGLKWSDVRSDPLNTQLQPYMIHGIWAFFVNGLVLAPTLGLVLGVSLANGRRRKWDVDRVELDQKLKLIRAQRAELTGNPVANVDTFRG